MLTEKDIEDCIATEDYITVGKKTTVCILTLKNGFEVIGSSACVKPEDYSLEVGSPYARKRAIDKVWELEGYRSQCAGFTVSDGVVEEKFESLDIDDSDIPF